MNVKEMANERTLYQGQDPPELEDMIQHLDYRC